MADVETLNPPQDNAVSTPPNQPPVKKTIPPPSQILGGNVVNKKTIPPPQAVLGNQPEPAKSVPQLNSVPEPQPIQKEAPELDLSKEEQPKPIGQDDPSYGERLYHWQQQQKSLAMNAAKQQKQLSDFKTETGIANNDETAKNLTAAFNTETDPKKKIQLAQGIMGLSKANDDILVSHALNKLPPEFTEQHQLSNLYYDALQNNDHAKAQKLSAQIRKDKPNWQPNPAMANPAERDKLKNAWQSAAFSLYQAQKELQANPPPVSGQGAGAALQNASFALAKDISPIDLDPRIARNEKAMANLDVQKARYDALTKMYLGGENPISEAHKGLTHYVNNFWNGITQSVFGAAPNDQTDVAKTSYSILSDLNIPVTAVDKSKAQNNFGDILSTDAGNLVGVIPKFYAYNNIVGSAAKASGVNDIIASLKATGTTGNKILAAGLTGLTAEGTGQAAGFPAGSLFGFSVADELGEAAIKKLPEAFSKGAIGAATNFAVGGAGAASSAIAYSLISATAKSLSTNESFRNAMKEQGITNLSDAGWQFLANTVLFGLGATAKGMAEEVKKNAKPLTDELNKNGAPDAANFVQQTAATADQVSDNNKKVVDKVNTDPGLNLPKSEPTLTDEQKQNLTSAFTPKPSEPEQQRVFDLSSSPEPEIPKGWRKVEPDEILPMGSNVTMNPNGGFSITDAPSKSKPTEPIEQNVTRETTPTIHEYKGDKYQLETDENGKVKSALPVDENGKPIEGEEPITKGATLKKIAKDFAKKQSYNEDATTKGFRSLNEHSTETQDLYKNLKEQGAITKYDEGTGDQYRDSQKLDVGGMTRKDRNKAIDDIEAGKKSPQAEQFLNAVESMQKDGVVKIMSGAGGKMFKQGIPTEEYFKDNETPEQKVQNDEAINTIPEQQLAEIIKDGGFQDANGELDVEKLKNELNKRDVEQNKAGGYFGALNGIDEDTINELKNLANGQVQSSEAVEGNVENSESQLPKNEEPQGEVKTPTTPPTEGGESAGTGIAPEQVAALKDAANDFTDKDTFLKAVADHLGDKYNAEQAGKAFDEAQSEKFNRENPDVTRITKDTQQQEWKNMGIDDPYADALSRDWGGTVLGEAQRLIGSGEVNPDALAEDLQENPNSHPKIPSDTKAAILLIRKRQIQNLFDNEIAKRNEAYTNGNMADVSDSNIRLAGLQDNLLSNMSGVKSLGSELGRGLNSLKMAMAKDYSLVTMLANKTASMRVDKLSPEIEKLIQEQHDKIVSTQKAFDDYVAKMEQRLKEEQAKQKIGDIERQVRRERRKLTKSDIRTERKQIVDSIKDKLREQRQRLSANPIPIEIFPDVAKLAKNYVEDGIVTLEDLVDNIHEDLKDAFENLTKRDVRDAISGYGRTSQPSRDEIDAKLREIKAQGRLVSALEDATKGEPPLKTGYQRDKPSDKVRELGRKVQQAMKENNIETKDPAKQLRSALEAVKTRLRNSIADLTRQLETGEKTPKKVGVPYDEEAKALKTQVDDLRKQLSDIEGKPEMSDEQRVKVATTAVEKSIAEYERRIKEKDVNPAKKESKTPATPELQALRDRRDALKAEYKELQNAINPKMTPEQRALEALKTRLANKTAEYQERLANEDFASKTKKTIELDEEGQKLKAANERAKADYQIGLEKDRLKNRSLPEKMLDTFIGWERFEKLSSPLTFGKLIGASLGRMIQTPVEELVQSALWKHVLPDVVINRANREGAGINIAAEAKYLAQGFIKGMNDAAETYKTGSSDLDVLFGKGRKLPPTWLDYFGRLHAVEKSFAKRNEFERSFAKRAANYMKNGSGVIDPTAQVRISLETLQDMGDDVKNEIGKEAYKDANRSIWMRDNAVSKLYGNAISMFEKSKDYPKTGKAAAAVFKFLTPFVRVPTNILSESLTASGGVLIGTGKLGLITLRGLDTITPEEADDVVRNFKKGSLGAGMMLLGYYNPQAVGGYYTGDKDEDEDGVKIGGVLLWGVNVPSWLLHNPMIEAMQLGATVRKVQDSYTAQDKTGGLTDGIKAGLLGMGSQDVNLESTSLLLDALDPYSRKSVAGAIAENTIDPAAVQWAARYLDKDADGNPITRNPKTALQGVESGIPGLRKKVPSKEELIMDKRANPPAKKTGEQKSEAKEKRQAKEQQLEEKVDSQGLDYIPPKKR